MSQQQDPSRGNLDQICLTELTALFNISLFSLLVQGTKAAAAIDRPPADTAPGLIRLPISVAQVISKINILHHKIGHFASRHL